MDDYIKREDAERLICSECCIGFCQKNMCSIINRLKEEIPAADVRENDISYTTNTKDAPSLFECKECGWESWDTIPCDPFVYCPGCGRKILEYADMRGGKKDG